MFFCHIIQAILSSIKFPPIPRPNNIRVVKKTLKLFLGLRLNPTLGDYPILGVPYKLVTPGAHSNKRTKQEFIEVNKTSSFFLQLLVVIYPTSQQVLDSKS